MKGRKRGLNALRMKLHLPLSSPAEDRASTLAFSEVRFLYYNFLYTLFHLRLYKPDLYHGKSSTIRYVFGPLFYIKFLIKRGRVRVGQPQPAHYVSSKNLQNRKQKHYGATEHSRSLSFGHTSGIER